MRKGEIMRRINKNDFGRIAVKVLCRYAIFLGLVLLCLSIAGPPAYSSGSRINCDPHNGACTQTIGEVEVTMEISPKPVKALQDLVFKINLSGVAGATASYIDLGMPAMKMGPNRVALKPAGPGKFEGQGVIVKCKSGKRTWFAIVTIPDHGEAIFVFDVIY